VSVVVAKGRRSGAGEVNVKSYFDCEATFQTGFYEKYKIQVVVVVVVVAVVS